MTMLQQDMVQPKFVTVGEAMQLWYTYTMYFTVCRDQG